MTAFDADGFRSSRTRKITINGAPLVDRDKGVFFSFEAGLNSVTTFFHAPDFDNIKSAHYLFDDGTMVPITDFSHMSQNNFNDMEADIYVITLVVKTTDDKEYRYTHDAVITGEESDLAKLKPFVDISPLQVGPKKVLIDTRKIFDSLNVLDGYEVDWGDGNTEEIDHYLTSSLFHTYSKTGTFEISLTVKKLYEDFPEVYNTIIKSISITSDEVVAMAPIADISTIQEEFATHVTFDINNSFSPTSEIVSSTWDHGDGTSYTDGDKVHTHFYNPGVYLAKLTVTDSLGLQDTQEKRIIVTEPGPPMISQAFCDDIEEKTAHCEFVGMDSQRQISKLEIDWGDGNIEDIELSNFDFIWENLSHNYEEYGQYKVLVKLETLRGESVTTSVDLNIEGPVVEVPVAKLSCATNGLNIDCDASASFDIDGQIVNYQFDFKDGTIVNSDNPFVSHSYENGGSYPVEVVVTDDQGYFSIASFEVVINKAENENPVALLNCVSYEVNKLSCDGSTSFDNDGTIVSYQFSHDNQLLSGGQSTQSLIFESGGIKDITLKVTDNKGATSETSAAFFVLENMAPIATLSCSSSLPLTLTCDGSSSNDFDGDIVNYELSVENQKISGSASMQTLLLNTAGVKEVTLFVTDNNGARGSVIISVDVMAENVAPVALFECRSINAREISCDASSSYDPDSSNGLTYTWAFDNKVSNEKYFERILSSGGVYQVKLLVKDNLGKTSELTKTVDVIANKPPVAIISNLPNVVNYPYSLNASASSSVDPEGMDLTYSWFVNGQMVANTVNIENYKLISAGNVNLTLEVRDNFGASTTQTRNIRVNSLPVASFECSIDDLELSCTGQESVDDDGTIVNYEWKINQAETEGTKLLKTSLSSYGNITVSLEVLDNNEGKSVPIEKSIFIPNKTIDPIAEFDYSVNDEMIVRFDARYSLVNDRDIKEFRWEFSNGQIIVTESPVLTVPYTQNKKESVELLVIDSMGREAATTREINIYRFAVPDPKQEGEVALLGIDSDSDGVRDDVQRYIIARLKGHLDITPIALKIARFTQQMIEHNESQLLVDQYYKLRHDQYLCLIHKMDSRSAGILLREIKAVSFNTKDRIDIWVKNHSSISRGALDERNDFPISKYGELCE